MKMTRYRNPRHRKWNGKCCDIGFFMCAKCDTYFRICVTQGDVPSSYSHGTCSVLRQEYGRYQHFHDVFSMNYGVSRPLSSFSGVRKGAVLGSQIVVMSPTNIKRESREGGREEEVRGGVGRVGAGRGGEGISLQN